MSCLNTLFIGKFSEMLNLRLASLQKSQIQCRGRYKIVFWVFWVFYCRLWKIVAVSVRIDVCQMLSKRAKEA